MNELSRMALVISLLMISFGANSLSLSCKGESKVSTKKSGRDSRFHWDEGNFYPDRQTVVLSEGTMTLSNFPSLSFNYETEPDRYSHYEISVISGDRRVKSSIILYREDGGIYATIYKYTNSREDGDWFDDDSTDIIAYVVDMQCRKPKTLF